MDVLELLDQLDQIKILFAPIYSADEQLIAAYEVVGEIPNGHATIELSTFSYDEEVPSDIRSEVEQMIVRQALQLAKNEQYEIDLFLPCNPNLLMLDFGEGYFEILKEFYEEEQLSCLTLVMAEHLYKGDLQQLHHVVRYLKTYGIKIALQDVTSKTQLDHILMLEPAILKINVEQLNYNLWGGQNHVFSTLKTLAVKIGASLLVDQVDTVYQLQYGWKNGVRYYKGEYLHQPQPQFIARDMLKERFKTESEQFIVTEKKLLEQKYEQMKHLQKQITSAVEHVNPSSNQLDKLVMLAQKLQEYAFRIYICDAKGYQTTPNIRLNSGEWELQQSAVGKNWSWRPYFLMNIIKMSKDIGGELSSVYSDIETGTLTRTYSMPLSSNEYLFVDISYDYLYEYNLVN